jgi:hypothetical protein
MRKDKESKIPEISLALVEHLEQVFPDKLPDPATPAYRIRVSIGNVQVTRYLREHYNRQNEG